MQQGLQVGQVMARGLQALVANHLVTRTPVLLGGDVIVPALAAQQRAASAGLVRANFLYEPDEQQLLSNFLQREPEHGPQLTRARVSWLYG